MLLWCGVSAVFARNLTSMGRKNQTASSPFNTLHYASVLAGYIPHVSLASFAFVGVRKRIVKCALCRVRASPVIACTRRVCNKLCCQQLLHTLCAMHYNTSRIFAHTRNVCSPIYSLGVNNVRSVSSVPVASRRRRQQQTPPAIHKQHLKCAHTVKRRCRR